MSSLNLPWCSFVACHTREKSSAPLSPFCSSESCREQRGHSSASFSPNNTKQKTKLAGNSSKKLLYGSLCLINAINSLNIGGGKRQLRSSHRERPMTRKTKGLLYLLLRASLPCSAQADWWDKVILASWRVLSRLKSTISIRTLS